MKALVIGFIGTVALGVSASAVAQEERDLVALFPREADVSVEGTGLARLPLSVEVLRASRRDLADMRLFDSEDREVPFLIDSGARPVAPVPAPVESLDARTLSLVRDAIPRQGGLGPILRESHVIEAPEHLSAVGAWDLVFVTPRARFVHRVEVYDDTRGSERLFSGSVFRLPSPPQEQVRVRLPASLSRTLRVVVEGTDVPLETAFRFEAARPRELAETFEVTLSEVARRREAGRTVIELARPLGVVPSRVRIETSTPTFDRPVIVRDGGQGGSARALGSATVLRVPDLAVDERVLRLAPASGDRLVVAIDDAGSPSLESLSVVAIVERPALVFHARGPVTLRFGGGRAHAPGYDIARFAGTAVGRLILVGGAARDASLGAARDNPRFDPRPALEFAMRPGPAVDWRRSTHHRELRIERAPEGLSRLRLGAAELAHARADLGDIRVVDEDGRTWPYLLERGGVVAEVPLELGAPSRTDGASRDDLRAPLESGSSRYDVRLPAASLAARELALVPRGAYLDRAYRVYGRIELPEERRARARPGDDEVVLGDGRLVRRPGDEGPLRVPLAERRVIAMWLVIEDGDDPALAFDSAVASMPSADLYLVAPPGAYRLLLGDEESPAARHEIARARDLVHAVSAAPMAAPRELEPNPRFVPRGTGVWATTALWIAIVLAVLVLGLLTLRLARSDVAAAPPGPPPPPSPPASPESGGGPGDPPAPGAGGPADPAVEPDDPPPDAPPGTPAAAPATPI